jgi:Bacterial Ig-like domain (group 3)/Beta-propeller repeat/Dockerin type I domain
MSLFCARNIYGVKSAGARNARRQWYKLVAELLEDRTLLNATGALQQAYGQLPLSFEANAGQTASQVQYLSHGSGYALFLTENSAILSLTHASASAAGSKSPPANSTGVALAMNLVGANPHATVAGLDQQSGITNYFIGNNPSQWHTGIANYAKVEYKSVYSGINLVYYGNQQQLEYDFVVAPGANPNNIQLKFQGANSISLDAQGDLVLHTDSGDVLQHAPVIYQVVGGVRQMVAGRFVLGPQDRVSFHVGPYNASLPLTIDPVLSYSTFLGGNTYDAGTGIAVDGSDNAYVTGYTLSTDFPTVTGAFQSSNVGYDAFVTELNPSGTALVYSTYLGGSSTDEAYGIAVDGSGNAFVTGQTNSTDFPTTSGAFQTSLGGNQNAFVTELNASGSALVYSTYLGGSSFDTGNGIAVDNSDNAYVIGATLSNNFPTTSGAFQPNWSGNEKAFITKLNATGTALVYSTYLGGSSTDAGEAIAVDGSGNTYVTGFTNSTDFPTSSGAFQTSHASDGGYTDVFVSKLNASGASLVYSTYLGGNHADTGYAIAVDGSGDAYVTGSTASTNFPTTAGAFQTSYGGGILDAFVTKLNADGTGLVYSTYLGGSNEDRGFGIALNASGNAFITGDTQSTNFPTTAGAFQTSYGGNDDAFVTALSSSGAALAFSTYLGGNNTDVGQGIAVDGSGDAYVTGATYSTGFPTTDDAFQTTFGGGADDAFVAKFDNSTTTTVTTNPPGPITQGDSVTFTANISNGNPGNVGTVSFYFDYGQTDQFQIGGAVNVSNGSATSDATTALPFGSDIITAIYSGGPGFAGSTGTVTLTVNQATTTSVSSNPVGPITQGDSVSFTADIADANPGSVGSVSFYFDYGQPDQFQIGGAVNVVDGSATSDSTTALPAGSDMITAIYSGGPGFSGSTGTLTLMVNQTTTTTVTSNPVGPITQGDSVSFTADIASADPADVGTVSFYFDYGQPDQFQIGNAVDVSNGSATSDTTTALPAGSDIITAIYSGGPGFDGSQGTLTLTVNQTTTTSVSSNPVGPIAQGDPVTFTADISDANPGDVGAVSFYFDYGQPDQFQIGGAVNVVGGSATSDATTALPLGSDTITAIYSGGDGFDGSQGTLTIQVTPAPPRIAAVVINQDISALYNAAGQPFAGAQRSMVNDIVYTFSEPVSILSPADDPSVFTIAVASGWTGTAPTLSWASVAGSGDTQWAVSFSGDSVTGGSIANGAYTITVTDPGSITAETDGQALSLATSGIGGATQSFYRLFGDINGDEFVNASDNAKFKQGLTSYNAAFDYNQDGFVNAFDNAQFKADLTLNFSGFTPTI